MTKTELPRAEGRPSKLTPELTMQLRDLLLAGNYLVTACDYVGIDESTAWRWLRRGERGWQVDVDGGYVEFCKTIKKAIAQVEMSTVSEVRSGVDTWQSRAWWLERRHPDKWGNRGKQEVKHSGEITSHVFDHNAVVASLATGSIRYDPPSGADESD